ncbi:hypothetical protein [Rhodopirellula baltica]
MPKRSDGKWVTISEAAEFIGITPQSVRSTYLPFLSDDAVDRAKSPMQVLSGALIELLVRKRADEAKAPESAGEAGKSSNSDEDRYRRAKADLAELELARKMEHLIDRESCRRVLGEWAILIRQMGEVLGKQHGAAASQTVEDTLTECGRVTGELLSASSDEASR